MLFTLLLTGITPADLDWPYWVGAGVMAIFLSWSTLVSIYDRVTGSAKQRELAEKAELATWRSKIDGCVGTFLPQGEIKEAQNELGRQIGENEKKIKQFHDGAEANYNAIAQRVNTLEIDNRQLIRLPGQFNDLHTDHKLLAQKVDRLSQDIKDMREVQEKHHSELMDALKEAAYTKGQLGK